MKQKLLSLLALTFCWANSIWADPTGDGSATNPYQITNATDLAWFAQKVNTGTTGACAVLTDNIDLSTVLSETVKWTPIGNNSKKYTGTFDGGGFTITGFSLTTISSQSGFFGWADGASIKNFTIEGSINSTHEQVGGVVGRADKVTISNVHSKVDITCTAYRQGGILGAQQGTGTVNIDCCTYSGTFDAQNTSGGNRGGFVGVTLNNPDAYVNITNCLFKGDVKDVTGDFGGFVGYSRQCHLTIKNCLSYGTFTNTTTPGQFIGTLNTNSNQKYEGVNYYITGNTKGAGSAKEAGTLPVQVTDLTKFTSGEICYKLNGSVSGGTNWYQTLDATPDAYPTPNGSALVYIERQHCDETPYDDATGYTNVQNIDSHTYSAGFCTYCGAPDDSYAGYIEPNAEGDYEIDNEAKLRWFAAFVSAGTTSANVAAKAKLTDNITLTSNWTTPIGTASVAYTGTFDGQGNNIAGFNATSTGKFGLFGNVKGATIENFSISGTLSCADGSTGSGVVGWSDGSTIRNIHSSLAINATTGTLHHAGGIVGSARYSGNGTTVERCSFSGTMTVNANSHDCFGGIVGYANDYCTFNSCVNYGTIRYSKKSGYVGGIVGYINNTNCNGPHNCLNTGSVIYEGDGTPDYGGAIVGRLANHSADRIGDNYWKAGTAAVAERGNGQNALASKTHEVTTEHLASGEIAYKLNVDQSDIAFYQTIGTDVNPTLNSSHGRVYQITTSPDFVNEIGTNVLRINYPAELKQFATLVNAGSTAMKAALAANIALTGTWSTPIGTSSTPYAGIFDGHDYAITGFSMSASGGSKGLFGQTNNATIKNFSISGIMSVSSGDGNGVIGYVNTSGGNPSLISNINSSLNITVTGGSHIGGVVGCLHGWDSTVDRCSFSGTITVTDVTNCIGGIVGYGTRQDLVSNCLFTKDAKVSYNKAGAYAGGILGYLNDANSNGVQKCLSLGTVEYTGSGSPTYGGAIIGRLRDNPGISKIFNNYWLEDSAPTATGENSIEGACQSVSLAQLSSGEVCAKLGYAFHQNIGTDANPTLDKTKGYVTEIKSAGWSTQYITDSDVTIPSGIEAFAGVVNTSAGTITLAPISDAIAAEEPVILRGAAGLYNFMPTTGASEATSNSLLGSDGTVTGGSNIYALAKLGEPATVGFYPLTDASIKIPAGRAYLVYSGSSPVKGFTFVFDDEDPTGIIEVQDVQDVQGAIFNLAGQRINKMQKGINIVNGRKVLF